jgi:hypothetical protein
VAVVVALIAAGTFTPGGSGKSGASVSYVTAAQASNTASAEVPGGPWNLVSAIALDSPVATSSAANSSVGSGCTLTPVGSAGIPTSVYIPGFAGSFSSGVAPWWAMVYYQTTAQELLVVQVVNGSAVPLATAVGSCTSSFQTLNTVPANVVDSSVAAAAVWNQGGSAFVSAYSNVSLFMEMVLLGGGTSHGVTFGASWVIEYTGCNPLSSGGPSSSQPVFEAIVDALSGSVSTTSSTHETC